MCRAMRDAALKLAQGGLLTSPENERSTGVQLQARWLPPAANAWLSSAADVALGLWGQLSFALLFGQGLIYAFVGPMPTILPA